MYLQESNLLNKDQAKLCSGGFSQIFHSEFGQSVLFEESSIIRDENGSYVIIQVKMFSRPVVLSNVYSPKWDNVDFFRTRFSLLPGLDSHDLILGEI